MAIDYIALQATANRLVDENGRSITLEKLNKTPADNSKPWEGPADPRVSVQATVTTDGVFVDPGSASKLGIMVDGSDLLKRSEQIVIVAPGSTVTQDLSTFDEIVDESVRWKIIGAQKLKPGSTTLMYILGVRR